MRSLCGQEAVTRSFAPPAKAPTVLALDLLTDSGCFQARARVYGKQYCRISLFLHLSTGLPWCAPGPVILFTMLQRDAVSQLSDTCKCGWVDMFVNTSANMNDIYVLRLKLFFHTC